MSASRRQLRDEVQHSGSWEDQLGKRVLHRGRVARLVHADLFRLVLVTEGPEPHRIAVDEPDWPTVKPLDADAKAEAQE